MKTKAVWTGVLIACVCILGAYRSVSKRLGALEQEIATLHEEGRATEERMSLGAALIARSMADTVPTLASPPPSAATQTRNGQKPAESSPCRANSNVLSAQMAATGTEGWAEQHRAVEQSVEAKFASQTVDSSWAAKAQRKLGESLTALFPASSSVKSVDCRSTVCRVEIVNPDAMTFREYFNKGFSFPKENAWSGPFLVIPTEGNPDGTVRTVVYFGEQGTSLLEFGT